MKFVLSAILLGVGATAILDLWGQLAQRAFGMPAANWALVGRWIGHMRRRRFAHDNIAKAAPVAGELAIGWVAHYAIGVIFAALLLAISGLDWAHHPTPLPALIVGLATVVAPLFIMQPAMGLGIAASKTANPNGARLRSIVTHAVFGAGLYVAALLVAPLIRG